MPRSPEVEKLNQLLAEHYELQVLFEKDVTVHSWFKMVYAEKCTVEEALVGIVVTAVKEKHNYYQMIVKLKLENSEKGVKVK